MAKFKSEYYQEKNQKEVTKLHELQKSLPVYMQPYLKDLELSHQVRSSIAYTREIITFLKYIREMNPMYQNAEISNIPFEAFEQINPYDINDYLTYLSGHSGENPHQNGSAALNRAMSALRSYFNYEVDHENLPKSPMRGAAKPRQPKDRPIERLQSDEATELLDGIERSETLTERSRAFAVQTQLRDTAIVTLLLNTGIRISECVGLDVTDIHEDRSFTVVRKGGKVERLFLNEAAYTALQDYINHERPRYIQYEDEPALFLSNRKSRMGVTSIQAMLKRYGQAVLQKDDLHPHTLRRTYGTLLYEATSDISLVSETLGHKDLNTTRKHYADVSEEHRRIAGNMDVYKKSDEKD